MTSRSRTLAGTMAGALALAGLFAGPAGAYSTARHEQRLAHLIHQREKELSLVQRGVQRDEEGAARRIAAQERLQHALEMRIERLRAAGPAHQEALAGLEERRQARAAELQRTESSLHGRATRHQARAQFLTQQIERLKSELAAGSAHP